jgi:hydrogenase maturation protein HypF
LSEVEVGVLKKQVATGFNVAMTSSTGRVLDAASALLSICRERTYDGEPAMKLESAAAGGKPGLWDLVFSRRGDAETLSSRALMEAALARLQEAPVGDRRAVQDIAASFQYNLARGIAHLAINAAQKNGMKTVALSGGVAYNHMIRETICREITEASLTCLISRDEPLGDGCVSFGQCVYAGVLQRQRA